MTLQAFPLIATCFVQVVEKYSVLNGVKCFLQIVKALEDLGAAVDVGFYHFLYNFCGVRAGDASLIRCLSAMWDPLLF